MNDDLPESPSAYADRIADAKARIKKHLKDPDFLRRFARFEAQPGNFLQNLSRASMQLHLAELRAQKLRETGQAPDPGAFECLPEWNDDAASSVPPVEVSRRES